MHWRCFELTPIHPSVGNARAFLPGCFGCCCEVTPLKLGITNAHIFFSELCCCAYAHSLNLWYLCECTTFCWLALLQVLFVFFFFNYFL
ncbi:hypothetical protein AHAS_Ahas01G0296500 [Arachis hypogaea]